MEKSPKAEDAVTLKGSIVKKSNDLHIDLNSELKESSKDMQEIVQELEFRIGRGLFKLDPYHDDIDKEAVSNFLNWHEDFDGDWPPCNAILTGLPGTGKSRALAYSARKKCIEGSASIDWITAYEFSELVSELSTDKRCQAMDRLNELAEAVILYFDDLGSASFTPQRLAQFLKLMDIRYRKKWPTFFSTNYTTPELKKLLLHSGASDFEATRILWRIIGTPSEPRANFFHFKKTEPNLATNSLKNWNETNP
jgi:DNA replication protein DnaC